MAALSALPTESPGSTNTHQEMLGKCLSFAKRCHPLVSIGGLIHANLGTDDVAVHACRRLTVKVMQSSVQPLPQSVDTLLPASAMAAYGAG